MMAEHGLAPTYYAPFARMEGGAVRPRDLREISPADNSGIRLVPQVIFKDIDELSALVDAVAAIGYRRVDLNLGCPFPPQVKAGRGAGALRAELLEAVADFIDSRADIDFSVKMRPGIREAGEWRALAPALRRMRLCALAVHPRTASQAYRGDVLGDVFGQMYDGLGRPLIYNGDVCTPGQWRDIMERYPALDGVMAGRGVLARPSLPVEIEQGGDWEPSERRVFWYRLMRGVAAEITARSCGRAQALSRLRPRLEYYDREAISRREIKALAKADDWSGAGIP